MSSKVKIAIVSALVVGAAGIFWVASGPHAGRKATYSEFLASVESGRIASVTILGSNPGAVPAICRLTDGSTVRTVLPADYRDALRAMQDKRVNVEIRDFELLRILLNASPFIVLLSFWIFMMRKLRNGPRQGLLG
jgi:cell division protease FtsH